MLVLSIAPLFFPLIIRRSDKPVLVKPFNALQKSKSEIVDNIHGFKDKKITILLNPASR
jgi:hypothetical protein